MPVSALASTDAVWWGLFNPNLWLAHCDIVWQGNMAVVQSLASLDAYLLDPCILGKMLGANGGKLTFWPPQPQKPLVP